MVFYIFIRNLLFIRFIRNLQERAILQNVHVPDKYQYRRLLNLISLSEGARGSSLMIEAAIIGLCDINFTDDISAIAGQLSMNVKSCSLDEFIEVMEIKTERHKQIENLKDLNVALYVLAASMIMDLIGKNVNVTNYAEWKQRRIRSYSAPLMLPNNDANSIKVVPSLQYAMSFYSEV